MEIEQPGEVSVFFETLCLGEREPRIHSTRDDVACCEDSPCSAMQTNKGIGSQ
jgi:hypothetical protein